MNTDAKIWVNGELLPLGDAGISPLERGFTLGDGLFETLRVRGGEILRLERHLARLRQGAKILDIPIPWTDAELQNALGETLAANGLAEAFIRLTLSRGVPRMRGLLPDKNTTSPTLVIHCGSFVGYPAALYQHGLRVITSSVRRNEYSPLANIKSLNYLDNILARQEAASQGADDALLLNTTGALICASAANLFFVQDQTLITAPSSAGALPGTMRAYLIEELAPLCGVQVIERAILPVEAQSMDEAFLTNALMGIMPLTYLDKKPLGDGNPGLVTLDLQLALG